MRTYVAAIGLIGVLASRAVLAQEPPPGGAPPPEGQPAATQPPPAEGSPPPSTPAVAAPGTSMAPTPFGQTGPTGPSLWGVLPWGGYGMGGRYMMPVPITPLLTRTKFRDYWTIEFGADLLHFSYDYGVVGGTNFSYSWTEVIPVVGMMWQVWLTEDFAVYPKIELGYAFGWYSDTNGQTANLSGGNHFFPDGTAGVLYRIGNGITLRAEAGYVGGKAGVAWLF